MASIYFDRDTYNAGETATITYVDATTGTILGIRQIGLLLYSENVKGSGSTNYAVPTALGKYEAILLFGGRVKAIDTMNVVSGGVPPKKTVLFDSIPEGATVAAKVI